MKKVFSAVASLLIIAIVATSVGFATGGFRNWRPDEWFTEKTEDVAGSLTEQEILALIEANKTPSGLTQQEILALIEANKTPAGLTQSQVLALINASKPAASLTQQEVLDLIEESSSSGSGGGGLTQEDLTTLFWNVPVEVEIDIDKIYDFDADVRQGVLPYYQTGFTCEDIFNDVFSSIPANSDLGKSVIGFSLDACFDLSLNWPGVSPQSFSRLDFMYDSVSDCWKNVLSDKEYTFLMEIDFSSGTSRLYFKSYNSYCLYSLQIFSIQITLPFGVWVNSPLCTF